MPNLRLLTIAREEGFGALYKGFTPKVLRLAPGGGVLLLVVEFTLNVFRKGASALHSLFILYAVLTSSFSSWPAVHVGCRSEPRLGIVADGCTRVLEQCRR